MIRTVLGSFDTFAKAQRAVQGLREAGFSDDDISIVASGVLDDGSARKESSKSGKRVANGALAGGVLGTAAGLVAGLGALALPGIGPIIAAGPLLAALSGAGVGALAGGMISGLTDLGVEKTKAEYYAEAVRRGGTLVAVRAEEARADRAAEVMRAHQPIDIERRVERWRATGWTGYDPEAQPFTVEDIERDRLLYDTADVGVPTPAESDAPAVHNTDPR